MTLPTRSSIIAVLVMGGARMVRSHGGGDLITAIYDAIIEPSGWDNVVKRIVEATKSVSGGILAHQVDAFTHQVEAARLTAICNADPSYIDAYVQHYHKINLLIPASLAIAPGEVRTNTHITQTDSFRASAIFQEWIRPQGWADVVGIGLRRAPKEHEQLRLLRSPDATWVEPPEWHLLETLAPHLQRAATIQDLLSRTRAATESLGAAIAAAGFAAFLLTGDCRVLFANAKAEESGGSHPARNRLAV